MIFDDRPRMTAPRCVVAGSTTEVETVVYVREIVDKQRDSAEFWREVKKARDERNGKLPWKYRANRNDHCPCGSGKKFKHCCYGKRKGAS